MSEARFHGVFPYLVSPIRDSGEVDAEVLARLCADLIGAGVHGLTPLGSTGEFAYLSAAQRRRVVEVVVEAARGRVPVVAGVALCRRGEWSAAIERQRPLWSLNQAFTKYNLAACIKGGLELQGYRVGAPLPPQAPLPPEGIEEMRRALSAVGAL